MIGGRLRGLHVDEKEQDNQDHAIHLIIILTREMLLTLLCERKCFRSGPRSGHSLYSPYQGSHGSDNADMGTRQNKICAPEGHFKEVPLRGTDPFLTLYPYLR